MYVTACKPCVDEFVRSGVSRCPGDGGVTRMLWLGSLVEARKDDPRVELYGRLDLAAAYLMAAAHRVPEHGRAIRLVRSAIMLAAAYAATGDAAMLDAAWGQLRKAYARMFAAGLGDRPMGWAMDLAAPELDVARAEIRRAEALAVALGLKDLATLLNRAADSVFDLERLVGGRFARRLSP